MAQIFFRGLMVTHNDTDTAKQSTGTRAFSYYQESAGLCEYWYPLVFSRDLKMLCPLRKIALGLPIVIWRSENSLHGFVDVCPHRQASLSSGKVDAKGITCPYHGWTFSGEGERCHIPCKLEWTWPDDTLHIWKEIDPHQIQEN